MGLLQQLGFNISEGEVTAPAPATCQILKERGLRPHLLVHDGRPTWDLTFVMEAGERASTPICAKPHMQVKPDFFHDPYESSGGQNS